MNDSDKNINMGNSAVGYTSVLLIFSVVCMMIFSVLSLKAAISSEQLNKKSGEYTQEFYSADQKAKQILCELDEIAFSIRQSDFFFEDFEAMVNEKDYIVEEVSNGVVVKYSVPVNDRQTLSVRVNFLENGSFEVVRWNCGLTNSSDDEHINVWDGNID